MDTKLKTKVEGEQAITQLEDDGYWSDKDTKLLLETLLGSDSKFYKGLAGNAKHVYQKISEKTFKGSHSVESSITGNGGGDPDIEVLDEKIENAQILGKDIRNLPGAMLKKWYKEGWYELFNNHGPGKHPGLVQEMKFCSGMISDVLNISSDKNDTSDKEHRVKMKKAHSKTP
ncbi:hypothetical protein DFH29DRAFT_1007315 [Suillus ampliporus]|nr:hypothetical protein DFH29DRAFT_1007315 [Suillus ampliporus]